MGLATAEAVVRSGAKLVPFTFTGRSRGVSVSRQVTTFTHHTISLCIGMIKNLHHHCPWLQEIRFVS